MANIFYNNAKEILFSGSLDFSSDTFKLALVDSTYTPNIDTDIYYDDIGSRTVDRMMSDITISYCPFSGSCVIFFDKWFCNGDVFKNNIVLSKGKLNISQLSCSTCDGELIRREEVNLMTLRNAIGKYPDCHYFNVEVDDRHKVNKIPIVQDKYKSDTTIMFGHHSKNKKYHPKSIVFGINYLSRDTNKNKYSVVVPKGTKSDKPINADIKKNGIDDYFIKMLDDVRERGGIIIPTYWFAWIEQFENSKVIELNKS